MKLSLTPVALVIAFTALACGKKEVGAGAAPMKAADDPAPVAAAANPAPSAQPASTPAAPVPTPAQAQSANVATSADKDASFKVTDAKGKSSLAIQRLVLASRVVDREPEVALEPKINEPLLAFVEAKNGASEDEGIVVTFEHESGKKVGFVELNVPGGAKRWRTWARTKNLKEAGNWVAVVRSTTGQELGRTSFTVSEG